MGWILIDIFKDYDSSYWSGFAFTGLAPSDRVLRGCSTPLAWPPRLRNMFPGPGQRVFLGHTLWNPGRTGTPRDPKNRTRLRRFHALRHPVLNCGWPDVHVRPKKRQPLAVLDPKMSRGLWKRSNLAQGRGKRRTVTGGIPQVFRGLRFKLDKEIGLKGAFSRGLQAALLILPPAAAGAGIVTADLGLHTDRCCRVRLRRFIRGGPLP